VALCCVADWQSAVRRNARHATIPNHVTISSNRAHLWPKASNGAGKGLIEKNSPSIDLTMSPQPADFWTPTVVKQGKKPAPSSTLMPDKAVAQPVLPNQRASMGIWQA